MKKVSKASWLVLAAGVLVITLSSLGMARTQQTNELKSAEEKLALSRKRLNAIQLDPLVSQKSQLTAQLAQMNEKLNDIQSKTFLPTDSIMASDTLIATAQSCGVEIQEIHSSGWSTGDLAEIDSSGMSMNIVITGSTSSMVNFVIALSRMFPGGLVNTVQLRVPGAETAPIPSPSPTPTPSPTPSGAPVPEIILTPDSSGQPTAVIQLTIYCYRGD